MDNELTFQPKHLEKYYKIEKLKLDAADNGQYVSASEYKDIQLRLLSSMGFQHDIPSPDMAASTGWTIYPPLSVKKFLRNKKIELILING